MSAHLASESSSSIYDPPHNGWNLPERLGGSIPSLVTSDPQLVMSAFLLVDRCHEERNSGAAWWVFTSNRGSQDPFLAIDGQGISLQKVTGLAISRKEFRNLSTAWPIVFAPGTWEETSFLNRRSANRSHKLITEKNRQAVGIMR